MTTLREYLKKGIDKCHTDGYLSEYIFSDLLGERYIRFDALPQVKLEEPYEDTSTYDEEKEEWIDCEPFMRTHEDLDFENSYLISLTGNKMLIVSGGDWQSPIRFSATYNSGDTLTYNNDGVEETGNYEGMTARAIIFWVFNGNIPQTYLDFLKGIKS